MPHTKNEEKEAVNSLYLLNELTTSTNLIKVLIELQELRLNALKGLWGEKNETK